MDIDSAITGIIRDISKIPAIIPGVYLFGSLVDGRFDDRSDIDLCLVAGRDLDPVRLQTLAWQYVSSDRYDIRIFELIPLYLQIHILARGILISSPDPAGLSEYQYPFWKRWDDQRWYQSPIP